MKEILEKLAITGLCLVGLSTWGINEYSNKCLEHEKLVKDYKSKDLVSINLGVENGRNCYSDNYINDIRNIFDEDGDSLLKNDIPLSKFKEIAFYSNNAFNKCGLLITI